VLPDDAADSAAAGVVPLERPETWDLSRFRESLTGSTAPTYAPTAERTGTEQEIEGGETLADKSRPR
jgi:hypothetical protein